jgi:hypothetical protein
MIALLECRRERYRSLSHRRVGVPLPAVILTYAFPAQDSPFDEARIAAQVVTPQGIGRYLDQCLDPSVTTMSVGSGS